MFCGPDEEGLTGTAVRCGGGNCSHSSVDGERRVSSASVTRADEKAGESRSSVSRQRQSRERQGGSVNNLKNRKAVKIRDSVRRTLII